MRESVEGVAPVISQAEHFAVDLGERVVTTFVAGTLGSLTVTELTSGSMWYAAAAGGVAAVVSLLKGLVARYRGNSGSASLVRRV